MLFSSNDVKVVPPSSSKALRISDDFKFFAFKTRKELSECIADVSGPETIHFVTRGSWSMFQLLSYILSVTGPANVTLVTWAFSENSARIIHDLIQKEIIKDIKFLFDVSVKGKSGKAVQLIEKYSYIKYSLVHAKVLLIQNEQFTISIIGSANFSQNPRIETGVIYTKIEVFNFHINWINDEFKRRAAKRS